MLCTFQVYRESGRHVDAFLELQQLRQVAPGYPGLPQLLTEAARAAAGSRQGARRPSLNRVHSLDKALQPCLLLA